MLRRRIVILSAGILLAVAAVVLSRWLSPALTPDERRLLGAWTTPEPDPRSGFVTAKGPVTSPWRVWELRPNRSFRVWVVSADDPSVSILDKEGRWSADGGKLVIEGFGATGDALREMRERARVWLGGAYVGRSSGGITHSVRFLDDRSWELTTAQGKAITWTRR